MPRPKHALLLVGDDNATELRLMHSIFDPSGYEVRLASAVTEALQFARALHPALIVCDVNMPGGTGFDFLATLEADAELRGRAVVIVTATAMTEAGPTRALALGAMRYVTRPIEPRVAARENDTGGWGIHGDVLDPKWTFVSEETQVVIRAPGRLKW